jgi:hypothetical protein
MDFAINGRVEPRVLVPWDARNGSVPLSATADAHALVPDWRGAGSVWDAFRKHCPPGAAARAQYRALRPAFSSARAAALRQLLPADDASAAPFVRAPAALTADFCNAPAAALDHGLFASDFRTLAPLLPVLSPARAPGFADVRVPSHYYYWPSRRHTYGFDTVNLVVRDADTMEVPWDRKDDKIYWRGASTGGGGSPAGYAPRYPRYR